ncbi:Uncharacterized protein Fot_49550 [Forsythia ovata]|uniref:Uncharacterized protein n=1 Tax=Forsythia ovata TaxID=205694 RepID=A0ABD1QFL9_9LAMI
MANACIARYITEEAPSQFVSVMRHRASKMLDTIHEEEAITNDSLSLPCKNLLQSSSCAAASSSNTTKSKHAFKKQQVQKLFALLNASSDTANPSSSSTIPPTLSVTENQPLANLAARGSSTGVLIAVSAQGSFTEILFSMDGLLTTGNLLTSGTSHRDLQKSDLQKSYLFD